MPTDTDTRPDSALQGHLTGWSLSAGDEHCVYDANHSVIVNVQCGGMTGRRYDEATDIARLIVTAPKLRAVAADICAILDAQCAHDGERLVYDDYHTIGEEVARLHQKLTAALAETRGVTA